MIAILFVFSILYYFMNEFWVFGCPNDLWVFMGMGKSIVSTLKYLYQIYLNRDRGSTEGFSVWNIIFDLGGGALSLLQVFLEIGQGDGVFLDDKTNIPKIGLSVVVIFFDLILIYQHYFVFGNKGEEGEVDEGFIEIKDKF